MSTITVSNLGKAYKHYPTRWSRAAEWLFPRNQARHQLHWVLKDINFKVSKGEAVGLIGRNGAGKSTLLKMIVGTTQPTIGRIEVNGRVTALLELGMGFHPDFTGRQNVQMMGQLLGLSGREIDRLIPEIEEFADIGDYINQPVRIYSSGMQMRLAFAVATCARPDILIVDEALSVGDIGFQAKCMKRMNDLLSSGVTALFVSHGLNQIRQFCNRAIYLSEGSVRAIGPADRVCDLYQNDLAGGLAIKTFRNRDAEETIEPVEIISHDPLLRKNSIDREGGGSLDLEFTSFGVYSSNGNKILSCSSGQTLYIR